MPHITHSNPGNLELGEVRIDQGPDSVRILFISTKSEMYRRYKHISNPDSVSQQLIAIIMWGPAIGVQQPSPRKVSF